jgi:hypothetical protein
VLRSSFSVNSVPELPVARRVVWSHRPVIVSYRLELLTGGVNDLGKANIEYQSWAEKEHTAWSLAR